MASVSASLPPTSLTPSILRYLAIASALTGGCFVLNNFLIFSFGLPGLYGALQGFGFGFEGVYGAPEGLDVAFGMGQLALYAAALLWPAYHVFMAAPDAMADDEARLASVASYIIRAAFWSVLLIGAVDALISFMRIEGFLPSLVGTQMTENLGRSAFRGTYVHMPLMALSLVIAARAKGLSFIWLASLIVIAELLIVLARFIFSYEQAFMGDLVRFWYAALFLFASAWTLIEEGHVRVDVIYAGLSERMKSWSNVIGALILGMPLCWVILSRGLWSKSAAVNSPLLNFETSQSGFGMYVKYIMASFLIIFALSMLFQFASFMLTHLRKLYLSDTTSAAQS